MEGHVPPHREKKGEKGIKILAPAPYKVKQKMEKLDEQGKPILDKDGKPLTKKKRYRFRPSRWCPCSMSARPRVNHCPLLQ